MLARPSIFISSTCFDLLDARGELRYELEHLGCAVRMSDDLESTFEIDPTADSIASCLQNVAASDVVVCILDRRYGGVPKSGTYAGKSATQLEIEHAIHFNKPIVYVMRDHAWRDYQNLRSDPNYATKWVEKENPASRALWRSFVIKLADLPAHNDRSNWVDQFSTSVELRRIVRRRLRDKLPTALAFNAVSPDRLVRLYFRLRNVSASTSSVLGCWVNAALGAAIRLRHGVIINGVECEVRTAGGLLGGCPLCPPKDDHFVYSCRSTTGPMKTELFCEYENAFGDRYRVTVPVTWDNVGIKDIGRDSLFVHVGASSSSDWLIMSS